MSLFQRLCRKGQRSTSQTAKIQSSPAGNLISKYDPHQEVWKPQFSDGDQSEEHRLPFFNSGFAACPMCGECNIWRFEEKAGIKPHGDTYGTETFICQTIDCGWKTTFKYDDGGVDCRHFEARRWPRGVHKYPMSFMMMWANKHKLSESVKHKFFTNKITGDRLLELESKDQLSSELGLGGKDVKKIQKALKSPHSALLKQAHH